MKLFHSPTSPFVRKVRIVAHETGLADRIELLTCAAGPINRDTSIVAHNPLGQVPTLLTDDDRVLADSRVICEFLDTLGKGTLFPRDGDARWQALADQSAADGLLDAALLLRYETFMRPEALRWDGWIKGQFEKVHSVLATFEARAMTLENRVDIGTITLGCAISYLDLRFADLDWQKQAPRLATWYKAFDKRPSMMATRLQG